MTDLWQISSYTCCISIYMYVKWKWKLGTTGVWQIYTWSTTASVWRAAKDAFWDYIEPGVHLTQMLCPQGTMECLPQLMQSQGALSALDMADTVTGCLECTWYGWYTARVLDTADALTGCLGAIDIADATRMCWGTLDIAGAPTWCTDALLMAGEATGARCTWYSWCAHLVLGCIWQRWLC